MYTQHGQYPIDDWTSLHQNFNFSKIDEGELDFPSTLKQISKIAETLQGHLEGKLNVDVCEYLLGDLTDLQKIVFDNKIGHELEPPLHESFNHFFETHNTHMMERNKLTNLQCTDITSLTNSSLEDCLD